MGVKIASVQEGLRPVTREILDVTSSAFKIYATRDGFWEDWLFS